VFGLLLSPFAGVDAQSAPTPADKLQIVNPVAGTKFKPGDTVKVSIVRGGKVVGYPVTISLVPADPSRKDLRLQVMTPGTKASDISWKVPATTKEGLYSIVAASHSVKIFDRVDVEVFVPKTIQLLTLNGGQKLKVGDTVQIKWKTNLPASIPMVFQLEDTRFSPKGDTADAYSPIPDYQVKIPNTGSYSWKIPATLGNGSMNLNGGNVYKLSIANYDQSNGVQTVDISNAVFSIVDPAGTGTGTAKFNQYDPASLVGETDQNGNTTSLETKFYMKLTASGGVVKMPKQSDFEIEFGNGKTITTCSLKLDRNLTIGSTGTDVVELQNFLESKGLLTMEPGVAKGYFGASTKTAVAKYQVSKGLVPADGYVNPLTRANVMADCESNTVTTPTVVLAPIKASSVILSADSYTDLKDGESRNMTVKGRVNVASAPAGLYTATLRVKTVSGVQEFPAQIYVQVNGKGGYTGAPSLTVSQLAQPILPNTHVISPDNGAQNIPFNGFSAKSEGTTSTIKDVSVKINRVGSSSLPTTVYLYDRVGTLYDSKAVLSDGIVTFNNNAIQIPKDKALDLIVKGDVSSAAISGSRISIDITNVVTISGTTTKTSLPLVGNTITFVTSVGNMGLATYQSIAQPTITVNSATRIGGKPAVVATFPLQVTAVGGNIPAPKASDFNLAFILGSTTIPATSVSVVTTPNNANGIAEGSISSVTVTAILSGSQVKSGQYYAKLSNIKTTNGYTDIFTPYSSPVTISSRMGTGILSASVGIALRMVFGSVVSLFGY